MSKDFFSVGSEIKQNLSQNNKTQWVEDSLVTRQENENYVSSNFDLKRIKWLFLFIILIFIIVLFRLAYLQLAKGNEYRLAAEENRIRIQELKAPRGIIYDRQGTVLAHNVPNFILSFVPADLPTDANEKNQLISKLSAILGMDALELQNIINQQPEYSYQSTTIQDHLPYEKAILLKIASVDMPGISLEVTSFREYLTQKYFSHITGYMGKITSAELANNPDYSYDDYTGKAGVELFYEDKLKGQHGKKEIEVDSLGKESKVINSSLPKLGQSIILTIDSDLQNILGQAIDEVVDGNKSITGAAAIAMNPNNGEIFALASSPTFDSNAFTLGLEPDVYQEIISDPKKPLFNRAIAGEYPSGSTIKPIVALAALEENIINQNTTILSTGGIQIDKWFFPDWKAGGHGVTDVKKAIAESVNTFFYTIGGGNDTITGLGVARLTDYMRLFGLGSSLGIDLAGEATGFLPSKEWKENTKEEKWYIGDTYHLSIGQGDILVTPLQVASYTATIANGGTFYQPHLIKAFISSDKQSSEEVDTTVLKENFISKSHFQIVKEGLRQSVTSGSARSLADLPVSSAGKTGTAQFGNQGKTHAWFTSFAPYENPEIVITILVEAGGGGESVALPIAKKGLQYWFSK